MKTKEMLNKIIKERKLSKNTTIIQYKYKTI